LSGVTSQYGYNGDGTRLRQIIAGVPTTYTQDLAAPLLVVLQSKTGVTTTKYLYSLGTRPVAQNTTAWEYLLPDALGSVRQIVDANGNVTLAESYEPYGTVLTSTGTASSIFGYAGEQIDTTGLIYLRARYMNPRLGIFLARDPWSGDVMRPGSMNGWNYAGGNPIIRVDPSGRCYPPLAFLRDIEPAQCANMDQALLILGDPRSTREQRAGPGFYVGMWTTSHAMFVVGAGILAGGGVIAWGTRALATVEGAKAAQIVSEHPNFIAEIGNCAENTWNSAQQAVQQAIQNQPNTGAPVFSENLEAGLRILAEHQPGFAELIRTGTLPVQEVEPIAGGWGLAGSDKIYIGPDPSFPGQTALTLWEEIYHEFQGSMTLEQAETEVKPAVAEWVVRNGINFNPERNSNDILDYIEGGAELVVKKITEYIDVNPSTIKPAGALFGKFNLTDYLKR
jgi:RHS repeat-associated protein